MSLYNFLVQKEGLKNVRNIFLYENTFKNHDFPTIFEERKRLRFDFAQNGNCSKKRRQ